MAKGGGLHGGFGGLQCIKKITGLSVDNFGLLWRLCKVFLPMANFLTPVQLLPNMIATGLFLYLKPGILYKAILTGRVIVLIDRPVGPIVSDILNPPSIPPRDCVLSWLWVKKTCREKLSILLSEPYSPGRL